MRKSSALLVVTLMALGAAPGRAQGVEDSAPEMRVDYTDLNLATPGGMDALRRRVRQAAATLCARPISNWQDQLNEKACETKAMAQALPQVLLAIRGANPALAMKDGLR